jgi:hypothetical protein
LRGRRRITAVFHLEMNLSIFFSNTTSDIFGIDYVARIAGSGILDLLPTANMGVGFADW